MNKGAETYHQIYPEGASTWGCKSGVLDVEDVIKLLEEIEHHISKHEYYEAGNICRPGANRRMD